MTGILPPGLAGHTIASMTRAPMQVVLIPFRRRDGQDPQYALFQRSDDGNWQPIAGGAEDSETPAEAARREAQEEARLPLRTPLYRLQAFDTVPVIHFEARDQWPEDLYVVPQYTFAADASDVEIEISDEHTQYEWLGFDAATSRLAYQSNAIALWELNERLKRHDLPGPIQAPS
jgi:dATP pyrophosphohydrolase